MVFSSQVLYKTPTEECYEVFATQDADTGGIVAHTLGVVPDQVSMFPLCASCKLALWTSITGGLTTTGVALDKLAIGGTSNPVAPVLRLYVGLNATRSR